MSMACSIIGCINPHVEWTTEFPSDGQLRTRWIAAIRVGTGQDLPDVTVVKSSGLICNIHFVSKTFEGAVDEYREPSLFIRDNVLIEVTDCRLCFRFDIIDAMLDVEDCLEYGQSLCWMANKYLAEFQSTQARAKNAFFCEECTSRFEASNFYELKIIEAAKQYEKLLLKMTKEKKLKITGSSIIKQNEDVKNQSLLVKQEYNSSELIPLECQKEDKAISEDIELPEAAAPLDEDSKDKEAKEQPSQLFVNWRKPRSVDQCYICNVTLETKESLIHHLTMDHIEDLSLECKECQLSFSNTVTFNHHLVMHDAARPEKCDFCPLRFVSIKGKRNHEASKHGIDQGLTKAPKVNRYLCKTCGNEYSKMGDLTRHERAKHLGELIARCEICDKSFSSLSNLKRHLFTHRNDTQPAHASTKSTPSEGKPIVTRNGGESGQAPACNLCDMTFQHSKEIVSHFGDVHPGVGLESYPCTECDEVFFQSHPLIAHLIMHTDKFACEQCGTRHASSTSLTSHKQSVHGVVIIREYDQNCPVCDKKFSRGSNLARHIQIHGEAKHGCDLCEKRFKDRVQLRLHRRSHSGDEPHVCPQCEMLFATKASLFQHQKWKNCSVNKGKIA